MVLLVSFTEKLLGQSWGLKLLPSHALQGLPCTSEKGCFPGDLHSSDQPCPLEYYFGAEPRSS